MLASPVTLPSLYFAVIHWFLRRFSIDIAGESFYSWILDSAKDEPHSKEDEEKQHTHTHTKKTKQNKTQVTTIDYFELGVQNSIYDRGQWQRRRPYERKRSPFSRFVSCLFFYGDTISSAL